MSVANFEDPPPDLTVMKKMAPRFGSSAAEPSLEKPTRFEGQPDRGLGSIHGIRIGVLTGFEPEDGHTL